MNACIRAVVRTAIYHGLTVAGIERGYWGMLKIKCTKWICAAWEILSTAAAPS